jgi:hypothetical protein
VVARARSSCPSGQIRRFLASFCVQFHCIYSFRTTPNCTNPDNRQRQLSTLSPEAQALQERSSHGADRPSFARALRRVPANRLPPPAGVRGADTQTALRIKGCASRSMRRSPGYGSCGEISILSCIKPTAPQLSLHLTFE